MFHDELERRAARLHVAVHTRERERVSDRKERESRKKDRMKGDRRDKNETERRPTKRRNRERQRDGAGGQRGVKVTIRKKKSWI